MALLLMSEVVPSATSYFVPLIPSDMSGTKWHGYEWHAPVGALSAQIPTTALPSLEVHHLVTQAHNL